ncbi:hypothetical protein M514_03219 [Trichuris suis]|uniref:Uncharacterized protein n=1 Tax=Trichuris suis TaxID=68888 RepID=A0A085MX27_9BILA|nr:hypothetical protein M513_03219 [Trichuris suis]KFD61773.1 hypothetical protein M514_03219 [Trichuris suis]
MRSPIANNLVNIYHNLTSELSGARCMAKTKVELAKNHSTTWDNHTTRHEARGAAMHATLAHCKLLDKQTKTDQQSSVYRSVEVVMVIQRIGSTCTDYTKK